MPKSDKVPDAKLSVPVDDSEKSPRQGWFERYWRKAWGRATVVLLGVTTIAAGFSSLSGLTPVDVVRNVHSRLDERQPHHDENILSGLRAGVLKDEFRRKLGVDPTANGRVGVKFERPSGAVVTRSEVYFLDTAIVEAFVASDEQVLGYSVVARDERMPQHIRAGAYEISFGTTKIGDAAFTGIDYVAGGCGAHMSSYFEVGMAPNAVGAQAVAVGVTDAGYLGERPEVTACQISEALTESDSELLPPPKSDLYVVSAYKPSPAYLERTPIRREAAVDSFAVAAPGFELPPELISLHPDMISQITPG